MSTTSVGTRPAAPRPARPWAASITIAVGLSTMSTIAAASRATDAWKKIFEPKRWPSLAPSRMNPETPSPYSTTAVPTVVGGVLKLATIPPMETGMADTLNDISDWPIAMTIIGSHEARTSTSACVGKPGCVAIPPIPPCWWEDVAVVGRAEAPGVRRLQRWPAALTDETVSTALPAVGWSGCHPPPGVVQLHEVELLASPKNR